MKRLTGKEMCRVLQKNGWSLDHVRGSHHVYTRPGEKPVSVPVHAAKTLKTGTQRSIMKAAHLTDSDLN